MIITFIMIDIILLSLMAEGAETLRSRLYRLETHNGEDMWA
jgi:hypothetical protein